MLPDWLKISDARTSKPNRAHLSRVWTWKFFSKWCDKTDLSEFLIGIKKIFPPLFFESQWAPVCVYPFGYFILVMLRWRKSQFDSSVIFSSLRIKSYSISQGKQSSQKFIQCAFIGRDCLRGSVRASETGFSLRQKKF